MKITCLERGRRSRCPFLILLLSHESALWYLPIGFPCVITTSLHFDSDLALDDWRGVEIYPAPLVSSSKLTLAGGVGDRVTDDVTIVNEFSLSCQPRENTILVLATCTSKKLNITWASKLQISP